MAAELGLLSLTQLQEFAQFRQQQSQPYMWNPNQIIPQDQDQDDDSWEVRAFEQDSSNITWPPRSYSCTFCTREFRSAQALGGHMNVHRRDRARLHQAPPLPGVKIPTAATSTTTTFLIPSQEIVTNRGLCFFYSLPNNPIGVSTATPIGLNTFIKPPPTNFPTFDTSINLFPSCPPAYNSYPLKIPEPSVFCSENNINNHDCNGSKKNSSAIEELDLELRLGPR